MNRPLFSKTPTVSVLDNRGLVVRNIAYHRHPDAPEVTNERITRHGYDARGFLMPSTDPRLHDNELVNFSYLTNLAGGVLRTQSTDNGTIVSLNDSAGRPFIVVSNISTAGDGTEDRSSAVTRTRQYDNAGRPVKVTEQVGDQPGRITERFVYAGHTDAEKALNLAGTCISHYDTAGLVQTDSIALTGVPLSVTRRLLKNADSTDTVADWQGEDVSVRNDLPDNEAYITLTTADATGSVLTTTDAQGNMQRMAYDVAGLLSGSWLTVKGDTEKVIVASLTYSAAGQKLREKHGNGVITTYTYEPETQRLIGIKTERPAGHVQGVKVLQDLRYTYDAVGNVLNITNDAEETRFWHNQKVVPENTYVYDSLYQLVSATGREMANAGKQGCSLPPATVPLPADNSAYTNYTRTYTYDNAGNLTQIRHTPATGSGYTIKITVSDRSNRGVLSTLTENPSNVDALFTAGGQQVQLQKGQNLFWTPRNELLKVTPVTREGETGDRESYRYDTNSRRLLKISVQKTGNSTQTQRVLYLPGLELRTTKAGSTETEKLQVITAGEAGRAQVRMLHWESGRPDKITGDQIRYSYDNLIGSSSLELDGAGNIISMEEYYPYGGTAVRTARNTVEADYKIIRYSGRYLVRVRAINAAEISSGWGYSEETRLTGKVGDPPMPLNFRASTLVFGIKLNWEFGKFTEDTLKTEIQYSKTNDGQNLLLLADVPYPSRSHELAGLAAGTAFYFRARLVDKTGNQSPWTDFVRGVAEFDASTIIDEVAAGLGDSQIIKDLQSQADDNFEAIINNANNAYGQWGYWQRESGAMKAEIIEVRNYTVTKTTALAEKLDAVQVKAEDGLALAQNSIRAQWDMASGQASVVHDMKVRIHYNGEDYSAGMVIGAELKGGEVNTLIGFNAQKFAFYNPSSKSMDLFMYMEGGQIFMREAFINQAWLNEVVVTDKMQSENYVPGKSGFLIDAKGGNAEFNSATFRGNLDIRSAASGGRMEINNTRIDVFDDSNVLRVRIGRLS